MEVLKFLCFKSSTVLQQLPSIYSEIPICLEVRGEKEESGTYLNGLAGLPNGNARQLCQVHQSTASKERCVRTLITQISFLSECEDN